MKAEDSQQDDITGKGVVLDVRLLFLAAAYILHNV